MWILVYASSGQDVECGSFATSDEALEYAKRFDYYTFKSVWAYRAE